MQNKLKWSSMCPLRETALIAINGKYKFINFREIRLNMAAFNKQ